MNRKYVYYKDLVPVGVYLPIRLPITFVKVMVPV